MKTFRQADMANWAVSLVIEPELEAWVFSTSPHVSTVLGWKGPSSIRKTLEAQNLWKAEDAKPADPKDALEYLLGRTGKSRSSSLFRRLASRVSTAGCQDRAFLRLKTLLQGWFPPVAPTSGGDEPDGIYPRVGLWCSKAMSTVPIQDPSGSTRRVRASARSSRRAGWPGRSSSAVRRTWRSSACAGSRTCACALAPCSQGSRSPQVPGGGDALVARVSRHMRSSEHMITEWSPALLRMELDRWFWRDRTHAPVKQVWDALCAYCYLPRLRDQAVFVSSVRAGLKSGDYFAYATSVSAQGRYDGLTLDPSAAVYLDATSVLVKPDVARAQREAEEASAEGASNQEGTSPAGNAAGSTPGSSDSGETTGTERRSPQFATSFLRDDWT